MKRMTHRSQYFCGNKISEYGLRSGYLDYRTLSKAFDAVLVNDITKLFYNTIGGEYIEPEQVNGYIDNSDEIDELRDQLETLINCYDDRASDEEIEKQDEAIGELEQQIDALEWEQHESESPEIFQFYIISDAGADIIKQYTNDPLYYLPVLDCYVWGVTHYGTSWDYVLTDCKLELDEV